MKRKEEYTFLRIGTPFSKTQSRNALWDIRGI